MSDAILQEQRKHQSIANAAVVLTEAGLSTEALDAASAEVLPSSETALLAATVEAQSFALAALVERVDRLENDARAHAKARANAIEVKPSETEAKAGAKAGATDGKTKPQAKGKGK